MPLSLELAVAGELRGELLGGRVALRLTGLADWEGVEEVEVKRIRGGRGKWCGRRRKRRRLGVRQGIVEEGRELVGASPELAD